MNILQSAGKWLIATLFSLVALAFLALGGLSFFGRMIGSGKKAFAGPDITDLAFDVQPRG